MILLGGVIGLFGEEEMESVIRNGKEKKQVKEENEKDEMKIEEVEMEFEMGDIDVIKEGLEEDMEKDEERVGGEVILKMKEIEKREEKRIGDIEI